MSDWWNVQVTPVNLDTDQIAYEYDCVSINDFNHEDDYDELIISTYYNQATVDLVTFKRNPEPPYFGCSELHIGVTDLAGNPYMLIITPATGRFYEAERRQYHRSELGWACTGADAVDITAETLGTTAEELGEDRETKSKMVARILSELDVEPQ